VRREFYFGVRTLAVGAVVALMLIAVNAREQAQRAPAAKQGVQEAAQESKPQMIQIDAVVTGKDGKFVDGLEQYDFMVEEDGELQTLVYVDHFVARNIAAEDEADDDVIAIDLDGAQDPQTMLPVVRDRRMIVLYFDLTQLTREEQKRSVAMALKFIKEEMTSADLVAVVSHSDQLRVKDILTNYREGIEDAVAKLDPEFDPGLQATTGPTVDDIKPQDEEGSPGSDETERAIFDADNSSSCLQALSALLGGIPGRKSVIEFTESSARMGIVASENESARKAASNVANKNAASLYVVDMREPEPASAEDQASGETLDADQIAAIAESRKALGSLAQDTDGKFFADVKDFATVIQQVRRDSQDYYLLTYCPSDVRNDGGFRKVSVTMGWNHDDQIKFRTGYYSAGLVESRDNLDHE
jgi:VWFA-related protein